jgi:hypothetical protein
MPAYAPPPASLLAIANTWTRKQTITPVANESSLAITGFSLTGANAQSLLDLAGTWNTTGTPTGIKLNITDTASNANSLLLALQLAGVNKFSVSKTGILITASSISSGGDYQGAGNIDGGNDAARISLGAAADVALWRDAANILAQRNGANAQAFRVYNSFTDASNYERFIIDWTATAGRVSVGPQWAGTGTAKDLYLRAVGGGYTFLQSNGVISFGKDGTGERWQISSTGMILAGTDNSFDIGAPGANRPRNLFLSNQARIDGSIGLGVAPITGSYLSIGAGGTVFSQMRLASGVAPTSPVNGDIWFDGTNLKMQIGGVTKTFTLT